MDNVQNDHLKAYGIAYFSISKGHNVEWLLNYRGGSFLMDKVEILTYECKIRGVSFEDVSGNKLIDIYSTIEQKQYGYYFTRKTKIAIYTSSNKQPWDDVVTLALTYAEVDYETLWDEDVH